MANKTVSIIIPIYNAEKYLENMLDSVLGQTYKNIEVVAVNDCSTDSSPEILEQYKLKFEADGRTFKIFKHKENGGVCKAINSGLKLAEGDYLCFPDADDELYPDYVETMLGMLLKNPENKWIRCDYITVSDIENRSWDNIIPEKSVYKNDFCDFVSKYVPFSGFNMMVERKYFEYCTGGQLYDSRLTQEWSLVLPLSYHSNYLRCKKKLYKYIHKANTKSSWIKDDIENVISHIEGLHKLSEDIISGLGIPDNELAFYRKVLDIYHCMGRWNAYNVRNISDMAEKELLNLYDMTDPVYDREFAEKINEPDLFVRFVFDKMLEMNGGKGLYKKYRSAISEKKGGYVLLYDMPGKRLYNAVCMAFGKPLEVSDTYDLDSEFAEYPKLCLVQNSRTFKEIKKNSGGNENLYFDFREIRDALREWAYSRV